VNIGQRERAEPLDEPIAETPQSKGRAHLRAEILVVTGLLFVQTVVLLLVRPNPIGSDGLGMMGYARDFPNVPANHHTVRIGLLLPTRVFEEILGFGQASFYAFPFLCSLLLVVATYILGRELFGRWVGCVAALLTVVNPILVQTHSIYGSGIERATSWQLLPDIPSTALFTLGLALLVHGVQRVPRPESGRVTPDPRWLVAAGLCFGWAYLIKETIPFLFPVIAVVLLLWRVAWRSWLWIGGTMVACFVAELVTNAALYGNALARFSAGGEQGAAPAQPLTRLDVLRLFETVIRRDHATLAWGAAVVLTVLAPLVFRRRTHVMIAVWALLYWVAMLVLSGVLDPSYITVRGQLPRYWIPIAPALAIGAAGALRAAWGAIAVRLDRSVLRGPALVGVVTAVALLPFCVPVWSDIVHNPRDGSWSALRGYLHTHNSAITTIVMNDRDAQILAFYRLNIVGGGAAWRGRLVLVRGRPPRPPDPAPGQWLLWTTHFSRGAPQRDSGWTLVMSQPELRLYRAPAAAGAVA
jgi:hypothetical protein